MALFGRKKEETKTSVAGTSDQSKTDVGKVVEEQSVKQEAKPVSKPSPIHGARDLASIIVRPRITEKAMLATDRGVYVFEVHPEATKKDIYDAVQKIWSVTPQKIRTVTKKPRTYTSRMRGKRKEKGLKKAYVYLKKGDTISF